MQKQVVSARDCFDKIEKDVVETAKNMIESFKFKRIYESNVSKKQNEMTITCLKEFRTKNWNKKLSREEAYKNYMSLY